MLRELERLIEKHQEFGFSISDFEDAASTLRQRQFLWADMRGQRKHYDLVVRCRDYFEDLFGAFGDTLIIDNQFGYCGFIPRHSKPALNRLQTIYLLILAKLHDAESRKACTENGRSKPSPGLLIDAYTQITEREKPKRQETMEALRRLEKQSVIQLGDVDEQFELPMITIMPNIHRVVDSLFLDALDRFAEENSTLTPVQSDEADQTTDAKGAHTDASKNHEVTYGA